MPAPRRVTPLRPRAGADTGALVALGLAEPPAAPSPVPPERPGRDGSRPDRGRVERAGRLADALAEAGVQPDRDDQAAVDAIAGLDEHTLATVAEWITRGKTVPGAGKPT